MPYYSITLPQQDDSHSPDLDFGDFGDFVSTSCYRHTSEKYTIKLFFTGFNFWIFGPLQTIVQVARTGAALPHAPKIWTGAGPDGVLTFCLHKDPYRQHYYC